MSEPGKHCNHATRLELLLGECLSETDEAEVLHHLDVCPACQRALEAAAADGKLWKALPEQLASHIGGPASERTEAFEQETAGAGSEDFAFLRECLGPTDHPDMLGRIGRYEVCGLVGQGSTGMVVKALEPRLNRYVAIKILAPSFASNGSARRRFDREGRAVAAVAHEHVVPIYAVDEYRGIPYIVMQYISGVSLHQRIERQGPLGSCQVVRIGLQVAQGLAAAHAQGIVHRDIKPANVMLENSVDRVLVTDFGLARVADEAAMTRSGVIAGTPQYMSPEQAKGEGIDSRSDLFSLGSTMYAACTGRPPFQADTVFGVIQRVCETEPQPVRDINPDIADWLGALISKLMSKRPEDRFETAGEVAELLAQELAHLQSPISVDVPARDWRAPKNTSPRMRLTTRPQSLLWAAGIAAILVAAMVFSSSEPLRRGDRKGQPDQWELIAHQASGASQEASVHFVRQVANQDLVIEMKDERVFPAKSGGRLILEADRGQVEVKTADQQEVKVVLTRRIAAADEEAAKLVAARHQVTFDAADGSLTIKGVVDPELRKSRGQSPLRGIMFQVTVPRNYSPHVTTAGGHITVKDPISGDVRVTSAGGHLTLANVNGPVWAKTSGGHITAGDVDGRVEMHSSGGHLTIGRVSDSVVAHTSGGNIKISQVEGAVNAKTLGGHVFAQLAKQPQSDCRFITSGGNVRVQLARDLAVDVTAATSGGQVTAPFSESRKRKQKLSRKLNGGGPKLEAKTSGGNIVFQYLDVEA